jgi:hypothetical protein
MIERVESEKPFLTYKNETLSFTDFFQKVSEVEIGDFDDFVIISEENPISFYTTLFALWREEKKVVFPNRDFF